MISSDLLANDELDFMISSVSFCVEFPIYSFYAEEMPASLSSRLSFTFWRFFKSFSLHSESWFTSVHVSLISLPNPDYALSNCYLRFSRLVKVMFFYLASCFVMSDWSVSICSEHQRFKLFIYPLIISCFSSWSREIF